MHRKIPIKLLMMTFKRKTIIEQTSIERNFYEKENE